MQDTALTPNNKTTENQREKGAVIIEATISLTTFMFAMLTLLSLIQIAYVQSRMSTAVCGATKELAQYAHFYYIANMDDAFNATGGKGSEIVEKVAEFIKTIGGKISDFGDELAQYTDQLGVIQEFGQTVTEGGDALSGDTLGQYALHGAGKLLIQSLMEKNLVTGGSGSMEQFLARNRIDNNLDFSHSSILENKDGKGTKNLFVSVAYDIHVIKLLNIDFTFHLRSWAYAVAWGD